MYQGQQRNLRKTYQDLSWTFALSPGERGGLQIGQHTPDPLGFLVVHRSERRAGDPQDVTLRDQTVMNHQDQEKNCHRNTRHYAALCRALPTQYAVSYTVPEFIPPKSVLSHCPAHICANLIAEVQPILNLGPDTLVPLWRFRESQVSIQFDRGQVSVEDPELELIDPRVSPILRVKQVFDQSLG